MATETEAVACMVSKQAVSILLECFLVGNKIIRHKSYCIKLNHTDKPETYLFFYFNRNLVPAKVKSGSLLLDL